MRLFLDVLGCHEAARVYQGGEGLLQPIKLINDLLLLNQQVNGRFALNYQYSLISMVLGGCFDLSDFIKLGYEGKPRAVITSVEGYKVPVRMHDRTVALQDLLGIVAICFVHLRIEFVVEAGKLAVVQYLVKSSRIARFRELSAVLRNTDRLLRAANADADLDHASVSEDESIYSGELSSSDQSDGEY
jgi:hypothetical protein